jgi:hypothetical protein
MTSMTTTAQLKLINNLSNLGDASSTDLFLIQKNLKSYKFKYSDLVAGLPDDSTIESTSNKLNIKAGGVDTAQLADAAVELSKLQNIDSMKVIGNTTDSSDVPSQVNVITNLTNASDDNIPTSDAVINYIDSLPSIFSESVDGEFSGSPLPGNIVTGDLSGIGFTQTPQIVVLYYKCLIANNGFSQDDELIISNSQSDNGSAYSTLIVNNTTIKYKTLNQLNYAKYSDGTTFDPASSPANWQFRFRVFA